MRRCKIPAGTCTQPDKPCCVDCPDKTCQARCENHPKRCGQWTDGEPKGRPDKRKYDHAEMARLRAQGLSNREIAKRLGCGKSTVVSALAKGRVYE